MEEKPADEHQKPADEPQEEKDDNGWDAQLEEELQQWFQELPTKPADAVGIPLPAEYTDDPTIPPAYNATCVKSVFFQDDNKKEFGLSIREHSSWTELRHDPVFRLYPQMNIRRFPGCKHEYTVYDPSDSAPSPSAIKMPPRYQIDRSAWKVPVYKDLADEDWRNGRDGHTHSRPSTGNQRRDSVRDRDHGDDSEDRHARKRSLDSGSEMEQDDRDLKRSRRSQARGDKSRENYGRAVSPRRRSPSPPRFNLEGDPWSPQAGESIKVSNGRRYSDAYNDTPSREERVGLADKRHDSGYHSGQSLEKGSSSRRRKDGQEPRPSDRRKPYRKRRSPSRSPSRSRASTPEKSSRSRSESPLTRMDRQLLGLTGSDSSESDPKPKPKPKPVAKKPVKRVKVAAAFG